MNNEKMPWNYDVLNIMSIASYLLSIQNLQLNQQQATNDDLNKHLQQQDDILQEQNEKYLTKIIRQNEEIIKLLKGEKKMKIKEYIEKIIENGKTEDMKELSDMLDEAIVKIKLTEPECYKKYKLKLMGMAYNYKFDKEMADEIVDNMRPLGELWDIETTSKVRKEYDINAEDCDFYIVINSLVNDYCKIIDKDDVETYVKMANAFINDEDAIKNKVWEYFTNILKED